MYRYSIEGQKSGTTRCSKNRSFRTASKQKLNLTPGRPHLVVLIGSDIAASALGFLEMVYIGDDRDSEISVLCVNNRTLSRQLNNRLGFVETLHLYETAENLPLLLDSADLLVTEPYEQILFEAAKRRIPIILTREMPQTSLPEYVSLVSGGCAAVCKNEIELANCCISLLQNDDSRHQMEQIYRSVPFWNE